ncbi:MAG: ABC transporter substrate-binding protein [Deltaproteobacteria bacterium]|nr:ABC transporter substrate-binding protein [Deltaproteobacteria bacterium]
MVRSDAVAASPFRRGVVLLAATAILAVSSAAATIDAADRFPLAMRDDRGVTVRLPSPPRRVVSLAPSLTESVFLLGKGNLLAGVTRYCNFPPPAASLPKVGGVTDPDVERIVALSPDIVLCTTDGNPRGKVAALEEMGIPCFATAPQDLDSVFSTIERIGAVLGDASRGRSEAAALRRRAERVRRVAGKRGSGAAPSVLFVVSTSPVIVAGNGTFMDELVRTAGGRNAAAGYFGRYPRLSVEDLVAASPDVIFVAGMAGVERFPEETTRWREVPAFRDEAVYTLDGDLVTRPGPRLVAALEEISGYLSAWAARPGESNSGRDGRKR